MIHLLKNLNIPIRSMIRESRHLDGQEIPSECMYPRRLRNMSFELPLCVDVENKAATWRQMLTHPCEHSLPVGEASDVINRIEYTKNRVKPLVDSEIDHILPREFRFKGDRVRIRRVGKSVVLEPVADDPEAWLAELKNIPADPDFMKKRNQPKTPKREIFK